MSGFPIKNLMFGVVGGLIGGTVGVILCEWLARQGLYAIVLPGALVGLGFGYAARLRSVAFGVVSACLGLIATLVTEWHVIYGGAPSIVELVGNIKDDSPVTWILMSLGTALAYSFGVGRNFDPSRANVNKNVNQ